MFIVPCLLSLAYCPLFESLVMSLVYCSLLIVHFNFYFNYNFSVPCALTLSGPILALICHLSLLSLLSLVQICVISLYYRVTTSVTFRLILCVLVDLIRLNLRGSFFCKFLLCSSLTTCGKCYQSLFVLVLLAGCLVLGVSPIPSRVRWIT